MVIVPTEKRFDWQHAPVVLFGIVLLNILLYFFYQVSDDEKIYEALESYSEQNYLELEWPLFKEYLTQPQDSKYAQPITQETQLEFADYQQLYLDEDYQTLSVYLLIRQDFYLYLRDIEPKFTTNDARYDWLDTRTKINDKVLSISSLNFGLVPNNLSPVTLISHQFLHGGLMHLMGNMFFLIICGFAVEAAIGHRLFLAFYLLSGIAGGLLFSAFNWGGHTPLVGASGAISGVMAMYLAVFRLKKIEFFYWVFVFVGYFRAPALFIFPFYVGKEIISFLTDTDSNVAFMAHTGGFIMGGALVMALLWKIPNLLNQDYIEQDEEIDPLQKQLAALYQAIEKCQFQSALKLLRALIAEQGDRFDWQLLRVKLASIEGGDELTDAQRCLFSTKKPTFYEIEQIEQVWKTSLPTSNDIDLNTQVKLALSFCQLSDLSSAEDIFNRLHSLPSLPDNLGVLARKLALAFESAKNNKKSKYYESFAEQLMGAAQ